MPKDIVLRNDDNQLSTDLERIFSGPDISISKKTGRDGTVTLKRVQICDDSVITEKFVRQPFVTTETRTKFEKPKNKADRVSAVKLMHKDVRTQQQLAEITGLSQPTISRYLNS